VDVKQVGRELGVRYVLEGSVRKAGNRVRITGQLIDASTGTHLWADRFDGKLEDVFDLQDQVTASVVGAIAPKLEQAEIERAKRKPTESLDAYDYFLRGMAAFHQFTQKTNEKALALLSRAIELDANFALAHGMAARCYLQRRGYGWVTDRVWEIAETTRLARRAAELGREDAVALSSAGLALAVVAGDLDDGVALIDRALVLNPNLAWAWLSSAMTKAFLGDPKAAVEHAARAMRLSPQDPQMFGMQTATAFGHFFAGRHDEALSWAETAVRDKSNYLLANCVAAASSALSGRPAEAEKAMARLRQLDPGLRLSNLKDLVPIRRPEDFSRWAEGLRKAGLPE
jgi:tetratricopeptide (TPR) repeat protein